MKKKVILYLLLTLVILSACNHDKNRIENSPLYDGRNLTIGVVGKAPKVREQNIVFKRIALKDLTQDRLSTKFDAVFIMKEYLSGAAKAPFAKIYKSSGMPFFFIESQSFVPFIDEETDYEEFPQSQSGDYAAGYYQSGENGSSWGYGLYNDTENDRNIEDVFSRIFKTIESVEKQK